MPSVGITPAPASAPEGRAAPNAGGPPAGHTGGFGEPTCRACHGEFDLDLDGSLTVEGLPDPYRPGETYVVTLVLRSSEMVQAGFQASVRFEGGDRAGRQAGLLRPVDHRTAVVVSSDEPVVQYIQHVAAGTDVVSPEIATWSFEWTAPSGTGDAVVLHASANSANGDNSPLGDLIYATTAEAGGSGAPSGR